MSENRMETTCACVVGGAGLAGMGFLFNALKSGAMKEIAANGLIVIDASDQPGMGTLGHYRITANSIGDVFIDCLRDLRYVKCSSHWDVGLLMAEASRLVLDHLVNHYGVQVWSGTVITEVISADDLFCLRVERAGVTRWVNPGGRQVPQHMIASLARHDLPLSETMNIQSADRLLRMNAVQLREVFALTLASEGRITLVGGSHSAFSMLENLADALEFAGLQELTLIHRSRIRLFYESIEEAQAAGYEFDPQLDRCPVVRAHQSLWRPALSLTGYRT